MFSFPAKKIHQLSEHLNVVGLEMFPILCQQSIAKSIMSMRITQSSNSYQPFIILFTNYFVIVTCDIRFAQSLQVVFCAKSGVFSSVRVNIFVVSSPKFINDKLHNIAAQ